MGIINSLKQNRVKFLAGLQRTKPIKQNKILFWSEVGKRYTCNPRHLSEYIVANYPGKFDIVWMFSNEIGIPKDFPKDIRTVRYFSKQFFYELATAKYVICNSRMPRYYYFKRRKEQIYLQTWHSSLRLKAIEADAYSDLNEGYIESAKKDSKQIKYILSGCEFSSNIFENAFWYSGELLELGTPRVDYLFEQQSNKASIIEKAGLDPNFKYILYAPTFRKNNDLSAYNVDFIKLVNTLSERFGGDWKVLFRLHPNIADLVSMDNLPDCCIDMGKYQDMQELLIVSDILMTDYSSSMFDIACLRKKCILYVSDLDSYIKNERKLYFDIEKLPFVIAKDNEELTRKILEFNEDEYSKKVQDFNKSIGSFEDGHACERICRELFKYKERKHG